MNASRWNRMIVAALESGGFDCGGGTLEQQRFKDSGLSLKEFIEQEAKANLNVHHQFQITRTNRSHQPAGA